ncbi:MAG: hypothetical protein ACJ780_15850 [Solirubrobacteraceae bacterium]
MTPAPNPGPRHGPERIHERAADPAEAANRPLEPTSSQDELLERDEPHPPPDRDPHHGLNNPVGTPDPEADSDPYRPAAPDDEADRASGVRGSGEGAEGR